MINFNEGKKIKLHIKQAVENQEFDIAIDLINQYNAIIGFDLEIENISAILDFYNGNLKEAEKKLLKLYNKFEFNFDVNYNLGIVYLYMGEYEQATNYYIRAMCIDPNTQNLIIKEIENMVYTYKFSVEKLQNIKSKVLNIFNNYQKSFPFSLDNSVYFEEDLFIKNKKYSTGIYDYYFKERDNVDYSQNQITMFKLETFESQTCKEFTIKAESKIVIPLMIKDSNTNIKITVNNKDFNLKNNLVNRYYYYSFNKGEDIKIISSNNDFVVGHPIEFKLDPKKPKLILNIFIDGLSQNFIDINGLQNSMPNSYKFFKEGTICKNTYVSGEWTYVSLASFFSGLYTTNHKVFHPKFSTFSLYSKELYSEVFENNGYFTAKIDGDWRSTPSLGYIKGINRYLYQPSVRGMHTDEVINETIEHLDAFKEKNNFLWICLPDLHDIADEFESRISVQVNNPIKTRIFDKTTETSVRKTYDDKKIFKYGTQLKRIDRYLGLLFNYIKENYKDDEYIISLIADHGQGYFTKPELFLDEGRTKVAMMFRGKNIPKGTCTEMIQGLDLFPIVLNAADIKNIDLKDGNIPKYFGGEKERKFTYTESIFPENPYRAVINDLQHKFFFETKENCNVDGRFDITGYTFKLINKNNNLDETNKFKDKVDEYLQVIFNHIKEYIII